MRRPPIPICGVMQTICIRPSEREGELKKKHDELACGPWAPRGATCARGSPATTRLPCAASSPCRPEFCRPASADVCRPR